ncbi:MAG: hypothetical protein KKD05_00230 [Candidatus Omnitrophica bacterium]|nr:hypothetical protein [Candidatus Omnitrophota bacterium]
MIRKSLTILFADVEGYTSRTGKHTRQEHEQFITDLQAFIKEKAKEKHGNFIKSMGDGFMLSFESPTDAVACGLNIQKHISLEHSILQKHDNLSFRIGISTGEVMIDDSGDTYGEAVNIAARIEKFAQVKEVYISESTYLSMNKSEFNGVSLGAQKFKNVSQTVNVYRAFEGRADILRNLQRPIQKKHLNAALKITVVLIVVICAAFLIRTFSSPKSNSPGIDIHAQLEQMLNDKDLPGVIKRVNEILQKDPHRGDLYIFAGEASYMLKNSKKAEFYLLKAIEHDPYNPVPYNILCELYANKRQYDKAINYLAEYLSMDINAVDKKIAINRMQELEQLKKDRLAAPGQPNNNQNLFVLSNVQSQDQGTQQPTQDQSNVFQTVYFSSEDDTIDAGVFKQDNEQALFGKHRDPDNIQEIKEQVLPYMQEGYFAPARHVLEEAEQKHANNPQFLIFSGRMYLKMSDHGKAEEMFIRAKDMNPDNPIVYIELSKVYEQARDYHASLNMLEEFIAREKDDNKRQKAERRLEDLKQQVQ